MGKTKKTKKFALTIELSCGLQQAREEWSHVGRPLGQMICCKLCYCEDSLGLLAHFRIGEEMRSNDQAMGNMTVKRGRISL